MIGGRKTAVADPEFPVRGGANLVGVGVRVGHQLPKWVLFS